METTATIIDIALIVMGVLQIILFFKIWGMTNDVKALKNKFDSRGLGKEQLVKKLIEMKYTGKIEEAQKILDANFEAEVFEQVLVQEVTDESIKEGLGAVISKYENFYKLLNCEMPKELKDINIGKVRGEYSSL